MAEEVPPVFGIALLDLFYRVPHVKLAFLQALQHPSSDGTSLGPGSVSHDKGPIHAARLTCQEFCKVIDDNQRELTVKAPCPVAWRQGRWPECSSLQIVVCKDQKLSAEDASQAVLNSLSSMFCPAGLQRITHLRFAPVGWRTRLKVIPLIAALPNLRTLNLTGLGESLEPDNWSALFDWLPGAEPHLEELVMPCRSYGAIRGVIDQLPRALGKMRRLGRLHLLTPALKVVDSGISTAYGDRSWLELASVLPSHLQELQLYSRPDNKGPNLTLTLQDGRLVSVSVTGFESRDLTHHAGIAEQLMQLPQFPPAGQKLPLLRLGGLEIPYNYAAPGPDELLQLLQRASRLELGLLVVEDMRSALPRLLKCRPNKLRVALPFPWKYLNVALRQAPRQGAGGSPGLAWPMPAAADIAQRAAARMVAPAAPTAWSAGDRSSTGGDGWQGPSGPTEAASSAAVTSDGADAHGSASAGGAARQQGPQQYVPRLLLLRGRRVAELLRDTEALEEWLRSLQDVPQDDPQLDGGGVDAASGAASTPASGPRRVRLLEGYQLFPCDVRDALLLECAFREGALEEVERAVARRAREEEAGRQQWTPAATPASSPSSSAAAVGFAVADPSSRLEAQPVPSVASPLGFPLSGLDGGRQGYLRAVEQELEQLYSAPLGGDQGLSCTGASAGGGADRAVGGPADEGDLVVCVMELARQVVQFPEPVFTIGHVEQDNRAADVPFWLRPGPSCWSTWFPS